MKQVPSVRNPTMHRHEPSSERMVLVPGQLPESETLLNFKLDKGRFAFGCILLGILWMGTVLFGENPRPFMAIPYAMPVITGQSIFFSWGVYLRSRECSHTGHFIDVAAGCMILVPLHLMIAGGFVPSIHISTAMCGLVNACSCTSNIAGITSSSTRQRACVIFISLACVVGVACVADPRTFVSAGGYQMFETDNHTWVHAVSILAGIFIACGAVLWTNHTNPYYVCAVANTWSWLISLTMSLTTYLTNFGYGSLRDLTAEHGFFLAGYGFHVTMLQLVLVLMLASKKQWTAFVIMSTSSVVILFAQHLGPEFYGEDKVPVVPIDAVQIAGASILGLSLVVSIFYWKSDRSIAMLYGRPAWKCPACDLISTQKVSDSWEASSVISDFDPDIPPLSDYGSRSRSGSVCNAVLNNEVFKLLAANEASNSAMTALASASSRRGSRRPTLGSVSSSEVLHGGQIFEPSDDLNDVA